MSSSEADVLGLVKRWADAELNGDAATLAGMVTDDFRLVGPLGFVLNKDQWLARYRNGDLANTAFEVADAKVTEFGDTVVVVAVQKQQTSFQGHDTSGSFRAGLVAVRSGAGWAFAYIQLSGPLGPPPAALGGPPRG